MTEQHPLPHVVTENRKQERVFSILAEQPVTHRQILAEQGFRFRLRHAVGQLLVWQPAVSVAVIRVVGTVMQPLVLLYQFDGYVRFRVAVEQRQQPCRFLRILCRQAAAEDSRQQQEQRLAHHRLTFKVSDTATSVSESLLNSTSHSKALPKLSSTVMVRLCDSSHSEV